MRKFLATSICLLFSQVFGLDPSCVRDIEENFFNPYYVSQALSLHDFSQSAWSEVNRNLKTRVGGIPALVRQKANKLSPNPFDAPYDPEEAANVLKEALYETLEQTLHDFNVTDPYEIREMFNYILEKQAPRWKACFPEEDIKQKK